MWVGTIYYYIRVRYTITILYRSGILFHYPRCDFGYTYLFQPNLSAMILLYYVFVFCSKSFYAIVYYEIL